MSINLGDQSTPTLSPEQEAARQRGRDIRTLCQAEVAVLRLAEAIKVENGLRSEQCDLLDSMVRDVIKSLRRVLNYRTRSMPVARRRAINRSFHLFMLGRGPQRGPDGQPL
jgi:glutamate mutase epsilon subunit